MSAAILDFRTLAHRPYELLAAIETQLRETRPDYAQRREEYWLGLGFRLRDRWCVAPRDDVREIIPLPAMTRAPGARPWLLGVANVRGGILPVADLAQFLGLPRRQETPSSRVLVFNSLQTPIGFLVDEVAGYRQFSQTDQRHERVADAGPLAAHVLGAFDREGQPWLAFSLGKVVASTEFAHAGW